MATRAVVGSYQKDSTIKFRRVLCDGYLNILGRKILREYDTREKAETLEWLEDCDMTSHTIIATDVEEWIQLYKTDIYYLYNAGNWWYGYYEDNGQWSGFKCLRDRFSIRERIVRDYILVPTGNKKVEGI